MKIDYELAEKIGATHYNCAKEDSFEPVRLNRGVIEFYVQKGDRWVPTLWNDITHIKPIPPKPQVRVEYENVEFIEDYQHLKLMIDGEVFYDRTGEIIYFFDGRAFKSNVTGTEYDNPSWYEKRPKELYRRIEVKVDKVQEIHDFIINSSLIKLETNFNDILFVDGYLDEFLEMCRVALRANGEL